MENTILKVAEVNKNFGGVAAIVRVSFSLESGELLGIIGPNGSGKTTLVNLLTGFVKPDSGKVIYQGMNITGKMPYKIAELGIVRTFQMVKPFYQLSAFKDLIKANKHTNMGFPVAEIEADGNFNIIKEKNTGGCVTVGSCASQLLYEIQGP